MHGRRAVVRNGYLPEREVLTAAGSIPAKVPKVRKHSDPLPPVARPGMQGQLTGWFGHPR